MFLRRFDRRRQRLVSRRVFGRAVLWGLLLTGIVQAIKPDQAAFRRFDQFGKVFVGCHCARFDSLKCSDGGRCFYQIMRPCGWKSIVAVSEK